MKFNLKDREEVQQFEEKYKAHYIACRCKNFKSI